MSQRRKTVWLDVEVIHATDLAIRVSDGRREAWFPRSQILDSEDDLLVGHSTRIEITEFLAEEKGLV